MKKQPAALALRSLVLGALVSGVGVSGLGLAATEPSANAPALKILAQDGVLCFSAEVLVNDKADAALSKQAEAVMVKTFKGLALKAVQYDTTDTCDIELIYSFGIDVAGAPSIYSDDLKLHSYTAMVGDEKLDSVTVWSAGYWGGDARLWTRATYTKKMQDNLVKMLSQFTADYRSVVK